MPQPSPWALHPLPQFPANFAASTAARHNGLAAEQLDGYQRWRRETWWHNEMGDTNYFRGAESFRRLGGRGSPVAACLKSPRVRADQGPWSRRGPVQRLL